jgi:hypothetical protein
MSSSTHPSGHVKPLPTTSHPSHLSAYRFCYFSQGRAITAALRRSGRGRASAERLHCPTRTVRLIGLTVRKYEAADCGDRSVTVVRHPALAGALSAVLTDLRGSARDDGGGLGNRLLGVGRHLCSLVDVEAVGSLMIGWQLYE